MTLAISAINQHGQVVGTATTSGGAQSLAFRTAPNSPINLPADSLGTLGGNSSVALGINTSGQVVGRSDTASGTSHAFRTAPNAAINPGTDDLGTLGGPTSVAYGINDSGQVVGSSDTSTTPHAFLTASNTAINPATDDIGALAFTPDPAQSSSARSVNAAGAVAGYFLGTPCQAGCYPNAFVYSNGTITEIPEFINAPFGNALTPINNANQVVDTGNCSDPSAQLPCTDVWQNGTITSLAQCDCTTFGLNNSSQIVGQAYRIPGLPPSPGGHAFLYANGQVYDLNALLPSGSGWVLTNALAINDAGQIIGTGQLNGVNHVFRMDPVTTPPPPPAGIALVQSAEVDGTGLPSVSVAFPSANTKGNLIVAFVRMSTTTQTVSISDSAGNPYSHAVSQAQTADGHQVHVFYAVNIAGGANTVKATFSGTNNHPWLAVYEYSGVNALDRTAAAQGWGAFASSGATPATSSANELLFAATGLPASYTGTPTAGSGFTLQQQNTATSRGANETDVVSATGAFTGTFNLSSSANWTAVIATFSGAAAPPANPPTITTSNLPNGTQNSAYTATLSATGGTTPYTWSVASGSLPSGLGLDANTGAISGTPTQTGTTNFTVQVKDNNAQTATKALSITINANGGVGAIALVQSTAAWGSSLSSISASFPSANTTGNLILAFVRMSTTSQSVAVSDSAGNVYTDAVSQGQTADGHQVHVFYAANVGGGANTVTANFSGSNNHPFLAIYEYSGVTALDQTAAAQGWGASPASGPTATTSSPNELVFAATGLPASYTGTASAGAGFTFEQQNTATSRAANEQETAAAAASFTGAFQLNTSANWTAVVATFRP